MTALLEQAANVDCRGVYMVPELCYLGKDGLTSLIRCSKHVIASSEQGSVILFYFFIHRTQANFKRRIRMRFIRTGLSG